MGATRSMMVFACLSTSTATAQTVIDFEGPPTGPTSGLDYLSQGVRFGGPAGVQEYDYGSPMTEMISSGDWYSELEIVFVDPNDATIDASTNFVTIENRWARDEWIAYSFDFGGTALESWYLHGAGTLVFTVGVIHRIVLDDVNGTAFAMDNLTFQPPVPKVATVCFGDGSGAACGCSNEAAPGSGTGCLNGLGVGASLGASGNADTSNDTLVLTASGVTNQPGLFFQGNNVIGGGSGSTFGDGIRCCGQSVIRVQIVDPPGTTQPTSVSTTVSIETHPPTGTVQPGQSKCYQYWYRNPGSSPCGTQFNLSNAVVLTWY